MDRIIEMRQAIWEQNLPNFLVSRLSNIRFLCGFTGSAGILLFTPKKVRFFTDFRYKTQAQEEVKSAEIIIYPDDLIAEMHRRSLLMKGKIGYEAHYLDVATYQHLVDRFPHLDWTPTHKFVEQLAAVKTPEEIQKIRKAAAITDEVFSEILPLLKPGVQENEISAEISYRHRRKGAEGDAFPPIVASGVRSALPHGIAGEKKIQYGDIVTIDMGCIYQGYASDLTRTVAIGKIHPKLKTVYNVVQQAQAAAIAAAKPGLAAKDLDGVAREIIQKAGFGDFFGHGLGHGLGIEVHSEPRVSFNSDDILKADQVITIEPGIYIPELGGCASKMTSG
jgi:Xaa-Pro aminopeptidase